MLGKSEGKRRRGQQRTRWLDNIANSINVNLSKLREIVEDRGAWWAIVHGVIDSQMRHSDWTKTIITTIKTFKKLVLNSIKVPPMMRAYIYIYVHHILIKSIMAWLTFWPGSFFVVGGCPVYCRMFSSIPDLNPLDASYPSLLLRQPKNVSRCYQMAPGDKIMLVETPLLFLFI